jgi:arginyl-tRNA synthetase
VLPHKSIEQRLQDAVRAVLPDADAASVLVRPCDPKFGDYQSNALISLAKARKLNTRQFAADVLGRLELADLCEKVEIAGPGFLNFRLHPSALAQTLAAAARGEHLFFSPAPSPRTIVIDFSSPNVAKPMHVGHIRSTILGDSLARTLRLLGHRVVTDNHIGDWGTQFGMLLVGWKTLLDSAALERNPLAELERIYKTIQATIVQETSDEVRKQFGPQVQRLLSEGVPEDKVVEKVIASLPPNQALNLSAADAASRKELVKLQGGDAENLNIWREMIRLSQQQFDAIYARLGVKFDHAYGESFYNPRLPKIVDDLTARGIARESEGARCVFSEGQVPPKEDPFLIHRDGEWQPNPQMIQKSDGGFNYSTTDLATLAFRLETWQPQEIVYVTDGRQQLHFQQLFTTFRRWHPELAGKVRIAHVWFGSILGDDNKPLKTRSGENVKLAELLDEAVERALKVVSEKNPELPEEQRREIARVVGLGSVKYADLLPNRQSDYVFSWDKMLAFNGNSAPYLLNAYVRIRSIFRKGAETHNLQLAACNPQPAAPEELALAKHLLNFGIVLEAVAEEYRPNFLCNYLYELAGHFMRFFENCPVLKSEGATRDSRLALCDLTAKVLKQGLGVLGIETLEQM